MHIPPALLRAFPPCDHLLLDVARKEIDDGMLREIAQADYGMDADKHLAALQQIRLRGDVSDVGTWHPGEVLELIRWSNPDDPKHKPGSTGRRGHQMRAFACAALLTAENDSSTSSDSSLAQCLVSARVLGEEMSVAAACYLTSRTPFVDDDRFLFALGLLIVATRLRAGRLTEPDLRDAATWFYQEEQAECSGQFGGILPAPFSMQSGYWKPLATELIEEAKTIEAPDVRNDLELIGTSLMES